MDLWRRRTPEQTAAAERVRRLLATRPTGWVPPPVDAPEVDHDPSGPEQPGVAAGAEVAQDAVVPVVARPGSDPTERPRPVAPPGHDRSSTPQHGGASDGLLALLRAGRLDPGRRAVAGLGLLALLACLLAGALVLRSRPHLVAPPALQQVGVPVPGEVVSGRAAPAPTATAAAVGASPAARVVVAVAGAVRRPGLVILPAGSRVDDAVRAAGGVRPGGGVGLLNLARRLVDGEQVVVGASAPDASTGPGGTAPPAAVGDGSAAPVDLNTATAAQLDALPGIGPVLAQRIVDHRTRNGPFRSVEDLRQVSGIGDAKFATLRPAVTV